MKNSCPQCFSYMLNTVIGIFITKDKKCPACGFTQIHKESEMSIVMKELLKKDTSFADLEPEIQRNLEDLLAKLNRLRREYNKPMIITNGYRSLQHHLDIYAKKGITDQSQIPMKSRHLYGLAVDVSDPNGELKNWINSNIKKCEEIGLWFEDFNATPNWVHIQITPPASGARFFKP